MIARILYRNNVHGVLKYVLDKTGSTVLGFQNTYSDTDTDIKFFGRVLYHLGNRHDSERRYVHISINLPRGEKLNDEDFFELSKAYMQHMGYGEQPYIVVRHRDTKHQHVHIVSTTIKEDCLQINLSNDFKRNVATQKYLEKQFNLSPSPDTRQDKELPQYEMPKFKNEDINGVRFYIQDIVNNTIQKYKVRSFMELAEILRPHHIQLKTVDHNGRIGVSYGIEIKNGYRSRFINGYTVHPQLSGPKLQKVFELNQKSKLLPMVKKRLEKQIRTTYSLFRTINPKDLPDILRLHQNLDCRLEYDEQGRAMDFTIYDKSGYVLRSKEIADDIGIRENQELFESEYTRMHEESQQLRLEMQRIIREAFRSSYQAARNRTLFSEHIDRMPIMSLVREMAKSERSKFLIKYMHTDKEKLGDLIRSQFDIVKDKLYISESLKEERELETKAELIKHAIEKQFLEPIKESTKQTGILHELIQSLGTGYDNGTLTYTNSQKHKVNLDIGHVPILQQINFYVSPGFIKENEKVLDGLLNERTEKEIKPSPTTIFLPLMFPNLYKAMAPKYRQRFDKLTLKTYHKYAERMHVPFEKSPKDYIRFFNAKGFHFIRREEKLCIASIYSKELVIVPLPKKTQAYLESSNDLNRILNNQTEIQKDIGTDRQDNLKSLWSAHLMERWQYKKAAYLYILEGVTPNLPLQIMEHHMENGFKEALLAVSKKRIDAEQGRILRRGIYALSNLFTSKIPKEEEPFNGFKDEMTDWSKYERRGLWI
ncbi:relaxase/mobilization nuclease domain-containing protein [Flavobacteriaceae bacterium F89]|uniref:Relaxase/mobilization nuclease domain-containing protein n=1 Tax=Cerina litoralis TaxID=2874477 RepID=A0AAE3EXE6_9FLAO|nr:relaxase/mobilization nuclease domain-containing protein [Cerina litoralis]MCG2462668.1 relaxase/mobilization nuclease domain-containing protein [Cerina litoralis]